MARVNGEACRRRGDIPEVWEAVRSLGDRPHRGVSATPSVPGACEATRARTRESFSFIGRPAVEVDRAGSRPFTAAAGNAQQRGLPRAVRTEQSPALACGNLPSRPSPPARGRGSTSTRASEAARHPSQHRARDRKTGSAPQATNVAPQEQERLQTARTQTSTSMTTVAEQLPLVV